MNPSRGPGEPDGAPAQTGQSDPADTSLRALKLRKLAVMLPLAIGSFAMFWGAVQGIFVPLTVQRIDQASQDASLALIVSVGAIASVIGSPVACAITDRARSRLGGRAPWMIVGALVTLLLALVLSVAGNIALIAVCYALAQFTTALILTPAGAFIPDRVPEARRGIFSGLYGFANLGGTVVGQAIGAKLSGVLQVGYLTVAGILAIVVIAFALANGRSNLGTPKAPLDLRAILSTFWVNPVAHPNFAWAFAGRFLMFTGFFPMQIFLLYLVQDYIGLGEAAVDAVPVIGMSFMVGSLVGTLVGGAVIERINRVKAGIYVSSAMAIAGLCVPLIWPSYVSMMIWAIVNGLGVGVYMSVDLVLVMMVLPSSHDAGKDLGLINVANTLPQTLGAVVGAIAIDAFGSYAALMPIAIAATVLGAIAVARIRGVK